MNGSTYFHSIIDEIILSGRGIRRLVTLCGTVTQLVAESDRRLRRTESANDDDGDDNSDDDDDDDGNGGDRDMSPEKKEEVQRSVSQTYH